MTFLYSMESHIRDPYSLQLSTNLALGSLISWLRLKNSIWQKPKCANQVMIAHTMHLWKLIHNYAYRRIVMRISTDNCAYQRILVKVDAQLRISTLNCAYIRIIADGYHHMAVSVWHQKSGMRWNLSPTPQSYKIS